VDEGMLREAQNDKTSSRVGGFDFEVAFDLPFAPLLLDEFLLVVVVVLLLTIILGALCSHDDFMMTSLCSHDDFIMLDAFVDEERFTLDFRDKTNSEYFEFAFSISLQFMRNFSEFFSKVINPAPLMDSRKVLAFLGVTPQSLPKERAQRVISPGFSLLDRMAIRSTHAPFSSRVRTRVFIAQSLK